MPTLAVLSKTRMERTAGWPEEADVDLLLTPSSRVTVTLNSL